MAVNFCGFPLVSSQPELVILGVDSRSCSLLVGHSISWFLLLSLGIRKECGSCGCPAIECFCGLMSG